MSRFIQFHHVNFSYPQLTHDLLADVNLSLHTGWTSICGVNGCGKSTLFQLIQGALSPTQGTIEAHGTSVLVPQSTEFPPGNWQDVRSSYIRSTILLCEGFGIQADWWERWPTLSMGERKRMQLACALAEAPDILLVDEPTNHVDEATKALILSELKKFRGVGVLISHDRLLLNELCTSTVMLEHGVASWFHAPYDVARAQMEQQVQHLHATKEQTRDQMAKLQRSVQAQNEKIDQGKKNLSKRNLGRHDADAKAKVNLAKLTGADGADSRKKQVLARKLEKASQELEGIHSQKTYKLGVFFGELQSKKRIHLPEADLNFDYLTIHQPEVILNPGDKLAITGANGTGKSTLMQAWRTALAPIPITYVAQEVTAKEIVVLTQEIQHLDTESRGKIMTLVSCLGSDPKTLAAGCSPSPGVWQKLSIAKAIVEGAPILFLDEPTNHMDLAAINVLEEALRLYPGILVMISHDRSCIEKVCNKEIHLVKDRGHTTVLDNILRYEY